MFRLMFAGTGPRVNSKDYANNGSGVDKHLQVCQMRLRAPRVCCVNQASTTGLHARCAGSGRAHVSRRQRSAVAVHRWVHLYVLLSDVG